MANLSLLTQITADEAWEAMLATEQALHHWVEALADGEVTPDEAATGIEKLEIALREAREAKVMSDFTYERNRASETLMREDAERLKSGEIEFSDFRRNILRGAGLQPIDGPDNLRHAQWAPARNDNALASD